MEDQKKLLQFVTWLGENVPELKGQAPEQIVSTINKLSESKEGQQMLQGLIEEFESSTTGMFKKGGKLDYLICLKNGGNIQDCGCGKKISKKQPGGSIASRLWNKWTGKDEYTDGYVAADHAVKGNYMPALTAIGTGLVLPNAMESAGRFIPKSTRTEVVDDFVRHLDESTAQLREDTIKRGKQLNNDIKSGKIKLTKDAPKAARIPDQAYHSWGPSDYDIDKVWVPERVYDDADDIIDYGIGAGRSTEPWWGWDPVEYQEGGRVLGSDQYRHVSRGEAIKAAMDGGLTRSQARLAYRNQKNAMSSNGFTGNEMKQHARWNIIDSVYPRAKEEPQVVSQQTPQIPVLDTNIEIEDIPIEINDTFIPLDKSINVQKIDKFSGSFDDAFASARRSKLDSFVWDNPNAQYDRYNTQLGKTTPSTQSAQQQEYEYNQQLVENAVNSPKLKDKVKSGILSTLNYPMK